jgi:hypothetical protein
MNPKSRVAPQPAFGHPLLAPLISILVYSIRVSPPCEGGDVFRAMEVCVATDALHSGARGLIVIVSKSL